MNNPCLENNIQKIIFFLSSQPLENNFLRNLFIPAKLAVSLATETCSTMYGF